MLDISIIYRFFSKKTAFMLKYQKNYLILHQSINLFANNNNN